MKTTIDLPERAKIAAVKRRTTVKNLMIRGLEMVSKEESSAPLPAGTLARLRGGYHLSREETHSR